MFFEIDNKPVVRNIDFLEEIGTLYDLLIHLLNNSMRIITSAETQIDLLNAINLQRIIISNMKTDITEQSEEKIFFAEQERKYFE